MAGSARVMQRRVIKRNKIDIDHRRRSGMAAGAGRRKLNGQAVVHGIRMDHGKISPMAGGAVAAWVKTLACSLIL